MIAISSVAGFTPLIARTGYAASKHAMHGFFDSLRAEVAPRGVGVTLVCPSFVATHIGRNAIGGDGLPVRHAQVTVGRPLHGGARRRPGRHGGRTWASLVLLGQTARVAWWLSRLAPRLYARIMARRHARRTRIRRGARIRGIRRGAENMKVHVKHSLKADVASVFRLCTEQKSQEAIYAGLGGSDVKIKREGRCAEREAHGFHAGNRRTHRPPYAGSCRA